MLQSLDSENSDVDDFEWSDDENFLDVKFDQTGNTVSSASGDVSVDVSVEISHSSSLEFLYSLLKNMV